jgi:hypothetical protein
MKRLKNFLRQIEREMSEPSDEELQYIQYEVKNYFTKGIMPENKFAKELTYKLMKGMQKMFYSKKYPSMPHEQWMIENPDGKCQPLDWVPSSDWKPTPSEPEPVKGKGKLHLVKKE